MTLDDWLAVYEQDPLDFGLLLPFADWCLEQGDERSAACLLWCHRHERSPDHDTEGGAWIWWNRGQPGVSVGVGGLGTPGDLPFSLWHPLKHRGRDAALLKLYDSSRAALLSLLSVWQTQLLLGCRHPACCMVGDPQDPPGRPHTVSCALCAWTPARVTGP